MPAYLLPFNLCCTHGYFPNQNHSKPFTAASLVEELAETIPGFQDSGLFNTARATMGAATTGAATETAGGVGAAATEAAATGAAAAEAAAETTGSSGGSGNPIKVVYLRKAQALAAELGQRFGREDARFSWADGGKLTADSGNNELAGLEFLCLSLLFGHFVCWCTVLDD